MAGCVGVWVCGCTCVERCCLWARWCVHAVSPVPARSIQGLYTTAYFPLSKHGLVGCDFVVQCEL